MSAEHLLRALAAGGISVAAEGGRLIVWPSSRLTGADRRQILAAKPALLRLLAGKHTCGSCAHFSRKRTCLRPVAAGLAGNFMLIWPEPKQAIACPAFEPKPAALPAVTDPRPKQTET